MKEMKLSIIIPIYNVQDYLEKCLESVQNQTYRNLEIICINDGSTDRSGEICNRFAAEDERFIVIHKANGGVSAARNAGLKRCTGDFIGFVDGDDWIEPDMYETLLQGVVSEAVDISCCGYFEDENGMSRPVENQLPVPEKTPVAMREFLRYIYIRDRYRGVASYLWNRIIRREVIVGKKMRFREDIRITEDQIFTAQCYCEARQTVYTHTPLYHYVQRSASAMHDKRKRLDGLDSCTAYQMMIDLYEKNQIDPLIVDYVKRFYVYHASLLLKMAFELGAWDKVALLKEHIRKYLDVYCRTNQEHPERIAEMQQLLEKTAESQEESLCRISR